jgi:hypothetical protein
VAWIAALSLVVAIPVVYSYVAWRRRGRPRRRTRASPAR